MKKLKLKFLLKESLLSTIENSLGTKMFRNSFYLVDDKQKDILDKGRLSCAVYVSSILYIFKLINGIHATVGGTVADLEKSGWQITKTPAIGDVIVWEAIKSKDASEHKHLGFLFGKNTAVSNDSLLGYPVKHSLTYGLKNGKPVRKITAIYHKI